VWIIACGQNVMAFRVKEVDPAHAPALAEVENQSGPSNSYRTMAYRPAAVADFARLNTGIMGTGTLDRRLKEMVYLTVSMVTSHDQVTVRERTALRYARETTREARPENETRDAPPKLFPTEQLVELAPIVSLADFTNRFSNGQRNQHDRAIILLGRSHRNSPCCRGPAGEASARACADRQGTGGTSHPGSRHPRA